MTGMKLGPTRSVWANVKAFGRLVRLSHTIFGLPFALAATALAHRHAVENGNPGLDGVRLLLIVLAFTGARAAAMGFNRIVDRAIDAENPRTADRELPRGVISLHAAWALTLASAGVFLVSAAALGPLPALLAPPCLATVFAYSYFKRFSWSSHLVLGVALALAPGGAWIAVTGSFDGWMQPVALMIAVATWVAGFDILYSLADEDFDRRRGLHSIPARFGTHGALWLSGGLHVATAVALVFLHLNAGLGGWHGAGLALVAVILAYEHWIVGPGDLGKLDKAFFDLNGYVSLAYLAFTLLDLFA
jgi:4-hydroxybenzoate polyprenyltransferase